MSRADSASLYGSKPPVNESRMPAKRAPRAHGLRSETAPSGWYPSGSPARKRRNGPVTSNLPSAAVLAERARMAAVAAREAQEENTPVRRGLATPDFVAERHIVPVIRMGDLD